MGQGAGPRGDGGARGARGERVSASAGLGDGSASIGPAPAGDADGDGVDRAAAAGAAATGGGGNVLATALHAASARPPRSLPRDPNVLVDQGAAASLRVDEPDVNDSALGPRLLDVNEDRLVGAGGAGRGARVRHELRVLVALPAARASARIAAAPSALRNAPESAPEGVARAARRRRDGLAVRPPPAATTREASSARASGEAAR